jgi:hypothetical protein
MHPDRGFFFDGRYDFQQFTAALPPTFAMSFWVRTEHGGTLFSTNGVYDDGDQHFVNCGIRGNRMEMGVSEGENFNWTHHYEKNKFGKRNQLIPSDSIHAESKRKPRVYYSSTDMDVITTDWQFLTYTFGDFNGSLAFNYYVNGVLVDTAVRKFMMSIFQDNAIYPTRNLFGAQERNEYPSNMFRGFIFNVEAYNFNNVGAGFDGTGSCGSCGSACTSTNVCLGTCEWNEFLNAGGACQRCPDWCREGCNDDGACPAPTHHERFP